jgi:hypothetical protein
MKKADKQEELRAILDETLQEFPEIQLPPAFTDRLMNRIERRLAWREILAEFGMKIGLVTGALVILCAVLMFPVNKDNLPLFSYLGTHWQFLAALTGIFLFTFFFDQVFLRLLFRKNKA